MQMTYRTALVTGASSGLGRGLARWLADRGVHVFAAARREEALVSLRDECRRTGGRVEPLRLDVADAGATLKAVRELDQSCGGLDLVIANAGVGASTDARKLGWEKVAQVLAVNVTGAAATLCAALPQMVERDRGHLVGVSSLAAWRGMPKSAAYCASKAFLATFLEGLRVDLVGTGVKVTTLYPGFVKSEMTAKNPFPMPFLLETSEAVERMGKAILSGQEQYAFPWQLASLVRVAKALPSFAWTRAAQRLR